MPPTKDRALARSQSHPSPHKLRLWGIEDGGLAHHLRMGGAVPPPMAAGLFLSLLGLQLKGSENYAVLPKFGKSLTPPVSLAGCNILCS
jgi:hypothetical protein